MNFVGLLFVNCLSELKSSKYHTFLPPKTSLKLQPLDQGTIQNLNDFYRKKKVVHKITSRIDLSTRNTNLKTLLLFYQ